MPRTWFPAHALVPHSIVVPLASALFVDTPETLDRFTQEWLPLIEDAVVALDIEEERGQSYFPRVALIQLSVDGHDAILDPIVLGHRALEPALEQILLTSKLIILHGGRNDVAGLRRDFGVGPRELGDTQIAARFIGERQFGLSALLEEHFGIRLDKEERRSDWAQRPLTESQLRYAQADTTHLEQLWHLLQERASAKGWSDAVIEECNALADVPADRISFDPLGWLKIKGMATRDVDIRQRATRLWWWRDNRGEQLNTHPSQLLPNWALEQTAIRGVDWLLGQSSVLRKIQGLDPEGIDTLREALQADLDLPISRPREKRENGCPVNPDVMRSRHDALSQWREDLSDATGMEPGWLAPRAVLEEIARATPDTIETLADHSDVRQWRVSRFAEDWRTILQKHR